MRFDDRPYRTMSGVTPWKSKLPWYKRLWFWFVGHPRHSVVTVTERTTCFSANINPFKWTKEFKIEGQSTLGKKDVK